MYHRNGGVFHVVQQSSRSDHTDKALCSGPQQDEEDVVRRGGCPPDAAILRPDPFQPRANRPPYAAPLSVGRRADSPDQYAPCQYRTPKM